MTANLYIRVDANSSIGTGHVMRCLALAQAWQAHGGRAVFIMAMVSEALFNRLKSEGMSFCQIGEEPGSDADACGVLQALGSDAGTQYLVVDGYHFSGEYQRTIKQKGESLFDDLKLLVVDDNREQEHYFADYILNCNIHATAELYPLSIREPYTKLLLGLKFCLLRRGFLEQRNQIGETQIIAVAKKILVTLGGADPFNITTRIMKEISGITDPEVHVRVIVGGLNPYYKTICKTAAIMAGQIEIIRDVDDSQMAESMCWGDIVVSAAGSTTWELCLFGVPSILVVIAENQRALAEKALADGLVCEVFNVVDSTLLGLNGVFHRILFDKKKRTECSQRMRAAVKDSGSENVIRSLGSNCKNARQSL